MITTERGPAARIKNQIVKGHYKVSSNSPQADRESLEQIHGPRILDHRDERVLDQLQSSDTATRSGSRETLNKRSYILTQEGGSNDDGKKWSPLISPSKYTRKELTDLEKIVI